MPAPGAGMSAGDDARRAYDGKTTPRRSLGRLEELGVRLAEIRGFVPESLEAAVVVAAGDHGVAAEGVSAYPSEVTAQMVLNFASGGAAINVLARQAGARLVLVDAGVAVPVDTPGVREGISYLLRTQGADGSWRDDYWTGTGFPRVFYLRYHLYALYFPILALGLYQQLRDTEALPEGDLAEAGA